MQPCTFEFTNVLLTNNSTSCRRRPATISLTSNVLGCSSVSRVTTHCGSTFKVCCCKSSYSVSCRRRRCTTIWKQPYDIPNDMSQRLTKPNDKNDMCAQRRSAWASAPSDQRLCCLHEENLGSWRATERRVKTNLSLRWAHMSFCWFCHVMVHNPIKYEP